MRTETLENLRRTDIAENSANNVSKLKFAIAGISISLFMMKYGAKNVMFFAEQVEIKIISSSVFLLITRTTCLFFA